MCKVAVGVALGVGTAAVVAVAAMVAHEKQPTRGSFCKGEDPSFTSQSFPSPPPSPVPLPQALPPT